MAQTIIVTSEGDTFGDTGTGAAGGTGSAHGTGLTTLREAINYANTHADTTITFASNVKTITLDGNMALIYADGTVIDGGTGVTIDGAGKYRPFFVSGLPADGKGAPPEIDVTLSDIKIQNVLAQGGDGASGGGGGAGMGGGVFVGQNAHVVLSDVSFAHASAQGGDGSAGRGGGGGGLGGNGGSGGSDGGGGGGLFYPGGGSGGFSSGGGGGITAAGGNGSDGTGDPGGSGGAGIDGIGGGGGGGSSGGIGGGGGGGNSGGGGGGGITGGAAGNFDGGDGGFGGGGGGSFILSSGIGDGRGIGGQGGFGGGGGGGGNRAGDGGFAGGGGFGGRGLPSYGGGGGALGGAVFVAKGGTIEIRGDGSIDDTGTVLGGAGVRDGSGQGASDGVGFGAGIFVQGGPLKFGAGTYTVANTIADLDGSASNTFTPDGLGGTGGVTTLEKSGTGTLTLSAANTYTGDTTVSGGKLVVDGSITNSATTVENSATLSGHGTLGAVTVEQGGKLAAGNSPGVMHTGNLLLEAGAIFEEEIGGIAPATTSGSGYDQTIVTGTVSLNGAILDVEAFGGFKSSTGQKFTIIDNDDSGGTGGSGSSDAVIGTFKGLSEGMTFAAGNGRTYQISYKGGDGNDVTLTDAGPVVVPNRPPVATTDDANVLQRQSVSGNVITDAPPDRDADGNPLTVTAINFDNTTKSVGASTTLAGEHGSLIIKADGSYTYNATVEGGVKVGATVHDVFSYAISDGQGGTSSANLDITVTGSATGTAGANLFDLTGPGTSARGLGGDDTYIVDRASDRPIEAKGGGTDTVKSSVDYALASRDNVENLTLTGTGDTDATGNTLANVLRGNSGDNTLSGDLAHDSLFGGGGADTYLFDTRPTVFNFDHIRDFSHAQGDTIALDLSVFRAFGSRGPIEASEFVLIDSKSEIVGSDAHLLYIKATGALYYDADGAGGTNRSQIAVLDNHATLTFQDFEVV